MDEKNESEKIVKKEENKNNFNRTCNCNYCSNISKYT